MWELWGPDERRVALAQEVSRLVQDSFDTPNPYFIPEDVFGEMLKGFYPESICDNLEYEGLARALGKLLGEKLPKSFYEETYPLKFGEFIDLMLLRQG